MNPSEHKQRIRASIYLVATWRLTEVFYGIVLPALVAALIADRGATSSNVACSILWVGMAFIGLAVLIGKARDRREWNEFVRSELDEDKPNGQADQFVVVAARRAK